MLPFHTSACNLLNPLLTNIKTNIAITESIYHLYIEKCFYSLYRNNLSKKKKRSNNHEQFL